ncbi:MAG: hypothetical protein ABR880_15900 [Candidatus Sulfotelmatobacter sp.]|jgi:hypothetical protein
MTAGNQISRRATGADLVALSEKDVSELACFIAAQSGRAADAVEGHLRWFLLENPARESQDPLGFGLRSADQLVGCILCSPQVFRFDVQKIRLMGSSSFYVDERYRGQGGRIFLQYSRLAKQWPLFGTSANAEAAALWKAAGASPIPYSDAEFFGVLHWPPLAEEFAHRRRSSPWLARLAGTSISRLLALFKPLRIDGSTSNALQLLTSAEQVNDVVVQDSSAKLTAWRDLAYIRWRYFSGRDASVAVFAFLSREPDRQVLVTVNQRTRGYRGQIRTLNVLDVYPEVPADEYLRIIGALTDRYRKTVDAIVLRGQNPGQQESFCERGFQRRSFDAPTGWFLDKAGLLPTHDWYPVPADGDGLI